MRYLIGFVLAVAAACGGSTGSSPSSVAGTWSFIELSSGCPMFEPDRFTVTQTGQAVAASFIDLAGNRCSLTGTYVPDRFTGVLRVESEERDVEMIVEGYSRIFAGERQVDGWARVTNDTEQTCVGDLIEFCARIDGAFEPAPTPPPTPPPTGTDSFARLVGGFAQGMADFGDDTFLVVGSHRAGTTFGAGTPNAVTLAEAGGYIARYAANGDLIWAEPVDAEFVFVNDAEVFDDGSFVVTGHYRGEITLGEGQANETVFTDPNLGSFVARYQGDGTLVWARFVQGSDAIGHGVTTFPDGSCAATGSFLGTADFGSGISYTSPGLEPDAYIWRLASDGTTQWVSRVTGTDIERPDGGIAGFPDGSMVIAGVMWSTPTTFGPGEANETTFNNNQWQVMFIARYNADGTLAWAKTGGLPENSSGASDLVANADGTCYITGTYGGMAVFGPGEANQTTFVSNGLDSYLARYAADGSLLWVRQATGPDRDTTRAIRVHTDGTIYWTGSFNEQSTHGSITLTGDGRDIFVARYASDGTPIWAKSTPGTEDHEAYDVVVLADGSPIIFARLRGIATFGAGGPNETQLDGSANVGALARYGPGGDF